MNLIARAFRSFSGDARAGRGRIFRESFDFREDTRLLDLGSEDGSNIARLLDGLNLRNENVYIADIEENSIEAGIERFGFRPVLLDGDGKLPFEDNFFDIVYCSSVIEHVTVPKHEIWSVRSGREFRSRATSAQRAFAEELRRIGRQYFVQTPNRGFPVESHTWLPLMGVVPRKVQVPAMLLANRFWAKASIPDFRLLDSREVQNLFPDAKIVLETKFGFTKSIMAIKSDKIACLEV